MDRFSLPSAALCQMAIVAAAIVLIALWPPQRGAMLMIPLSGHAASVIDVALDGGADLLAKGPLPGSMIVRGDRALLGSPAFDRGILLLSAPRALCGDGSPERIG